MNDSDGTVYLDHAATTPMVPEAIAAMAEQMALTGNASSLHAAGRAARRTVEEARELIAERFGARPSEVVFTSGGTEANNLAIKGLYWSRLAEDPARKHIVFSSIEHHALLDPVTWLATHEGAEVDMTPVDKQGRIVVDDLRAAVERDPARVSAVTTMWANNEMGTIQPIHEVVEIARAHDIPVHSDAVQAAGYLPLDFAASGLDAMTITAHKLGGPVGVGALVIGREIDLTPLLHGGGQERDLRSGTLSVPLIAAFAAAVEVTVSRQAETVARIEALRERLVEGIVHVVPDAIVNGDPLPGPEHRLPNIAHVTFPGCEGDAMLMLLDAQGIECSTGSACAAGVPQPSHVLLAMGYDDVAARGSLRFSLGHTSTQQDVDRLLEALPAVHQRAQRASLVRSAS
ncbi:cysteine desulfurase family protein [Aeromicrobium chenweiae]|uniref:cysteine desulfurase n=1 Tax=Aeromicrobium chenweiae TaxID=2079793 RepID=A0A2S0WNG0_9ACTN|nr:cysteine desulfurase family protein [Aeromicrobium chenweiae]AWB92883.1 cysteine desulfurase NifS [Aeromicrobium chenweiae]TGN33878.1 cysteine desulfurase [Aeromicrobium chenweiae]